MNPIRVLVIEDGEEYIRTLGRYLGEGFALARAGSGPEALALLRAERFDVIFLDMRFDRAPTDALLGDVAASAERAGGDAARGLAFIVENQGAYVLAALREAGCAVPVVFSYDFDAEPRRWRHLSERYAPLRYLTDNAGPDAIRAALRDAAGS